EDDLEELEAVGRLGKEEGGEHVFGGRARGQFVVAEDFGGDGEMGGEEDGGLEVLQPVAAPTPALVNADDRGGEKRPAEQKGEAQQSTPDAGDSNPSPEVGYGRDAESQANGGDAV